MHSIKKLSSLQKKNIVWNCFVTLQTPILTKELHSFSIKKTTFPTNLWVAIIVISFHKVAGSLLYRYQLQKEHMAERSLHSNGAIPMSTFSNWMGLRFLRMRNSAVPSGRGAEQNGKAGDSSLVLNGKASGETHQSRE